MCKILAIPFTDRNPKQCLDIAKAVSKKMMANDKDGFGFIAADSNGNAWSEKWQNVKQAWHGDTKTELPESLRAFGETLQEYSPYDSEGTKGDLTKLTSLVCHARMATCGKDLHNVHPFYLEGTFLVHNGIINNADLFLDGFDKSDCDSYAILKRYNEHTCYDLDGLKNIEKVYNDLTGYMACAAYNSDTGYLDIWKDTRAQLGVVYVPALDTPIYCTVIEWVIVELKKRKLKYVVYRMPENTVHRFDIAAREAVTGVTVYPKPKIERYHAMPEYRTSAFDFNEAGVKHVID